MTMSLLPSQFMFFAWEGQRLWGWPLSPISLVLTLEYRLGPKGAF